MIRSQMFKWLAAGALALSVPAVGMARHTSHFTAASKLSAVKTTKVSTSAKPLIASKSSLKSKAHAKKKSHVSTRHHSSKLSTKAHLKSHKASKLTAKSRHRAA